MFPSAGDELALKPAGLAIAAVSFVLTRSFLVDIFYPAPGTGVLRVVFSLFPMLLGFAIVVFGVSLTVSTHSRSFARRITGFYFVSTAVMLLLLGIGAFADGMSPVAFLQSGVVGVAIVGSGGGGILLGVQSAQNHDQRRMLRQRTEQATLLNRLMRHEILNSLTAIRGHAELLSDGDGSERSWVAVRNNSDRIERVVEDVRFLFPTTDGASTDSRTVELRPILRRCAERLHDPEETLVFPGDVSGVSVRGDEHLATVLDELVTRARERTDGPDVTVAVDVDDTTVDLHVSAAGEWITDTEKRALLDGPPEYDDPRLAYGVSIVRQLVARYGGTLSLVEEGGTTTVTVELLRTAEESPTANDHGVDSETLRNASVAGLVAGVGMGLVLQTLSGGVGVIGSLYGSSTATVGWPVHLFHSVVFATLGVTARKRPSVRKRFESLGGAVSLGVGYGLLLWFVAGGLVMSLWLNSIGIQTPVPDLDVPSLIAHVVWGALFGLLVYLLPVTEG